MEENVKVEAKKMPKKLPLIIMLCIIVVLGAGFVGLCLSGNIPVLTNMGAVSYEDGLLLKEVSNVQDEATLRQLLLMNKDLDIVVTKDITINETMIVNGNKTLTGDAKISGDFMGTFKVSSIFEVSPSAHLTIDGLTLDGGAGGDGITVKQNAELTYLSGNMQYVRYGIRTNGKVNIEDIYIEKASLSGIYSSFKSEVILKKGTFYDGYEHMLYIEDGGYMEIYEDVLITDCINYGIYNAGKLRIYGGELRNLGNYAIVNAGDMIVEYKGSQKDGYIYMHDLEKRAFNVDSSDDTIIQDVYVKNAKSNAIYITDKVTQGDTTIKNVVFDGCGSNDGTNTSLWGDVTLENVTYKNAYKGGLKVRNGATVNAKNIVIENNGATGIEMEGILYAENITIDGNKGNAIAFGSKAGDEGIFGEIKNLTIRNCDANNIVVRENASGHLIDTVLEKSKRTNISMQKNCELIIENTKVMGVKDEKLKSVSLMEGSKVTMKGDSLITGATHGAVNISTNATFNMEGGAIENVNAKLSGAAVRLDKEGAVFNMSGGVIQNCTTCEAAGAVYVAHKATFNMTGGTIRKNTTQKSGGAVYTMGTMNMSGGTIEDNKAGTNGGGIAVADDKTKGYIGKLNMTGGVIQNNYAADNGGGFAVYADTNANGDLVKAVANMSGGTVRGNDCGQYGTGIYVSGTFTLSNNAYVKNNAVQVNKNSTTIAIKGDSLSKHSANDPLLVVPHRETSGTMKVITCDSVQAAASLLTEVKSGTKAFTLAQLSDAISVSINEADMSMTGADKVYVSNYEQFKEAVETTKTKRYVILTANIEIESAVTVPSGTTVYIKDDGNVRTLTRGPKCTGSMIRTYYGTGLYIVGTSYGNIVIDGQAAKVAANVAKNEAALRLRGGTELRNVVLKNNNNGTSNGGGLIKYSNGHLKMESSALLDGISKSGGGAIEIVSGSAELINCNFENNVSLKSGGAIKASKGSGTVEIVGCDFNCNKSDTNGGAINADAVGMLHVTDSFFRSNTSTGKQGGAVAITGKTKAVFDGNGTFSENTTPANTGGAIYTNNSSLAITGYDFISNTGLDGGAIHINEDGSDVVTVTECTFLLNNANGVPEGDADKPGRGGAIYNSKRTLTLTDCVFGADGYSNTSVCSGGAIYSGGSGTLNLVGTTPEAKFAYNKAGKDGGAICIGSGRLTSDGYTFEGNTGKAGGAIQFNNNVASSCDIANSLFIKNSSLEGDGGAIRNNLGTITDNKFIIRGCTFGTSTEDANTSTGGAGGAIYNRIAVMEISNSTFSYNQSIDKSSGAVYNKGTMTITNSTFTGNKAASGGGALKTAGGEVTVISSQFIENTAPMFGGAINIGSDTRSGVTISGTVVLQGTIAEGVTNPTLQNGITNPTLLQGNYTNKDGGGAIGVENGTLITNGCRFDGNTGTNGGAILFTNNEASSCDIQNAVFVNNTAITGDGGAIRNNVQTAAEDKSFNFTNCTFGTSAEDGNTSKKAGGAIYCHSAAMNITTSTFTGNASTGASGGAVYTKGPLIITGSAFDSNDANTNGGAISNDGGNMTVSTTSFTGNYAAALGGAVYNASSGTTVFNGTCQSTEAFTGNQAKTLGGGIYVASGKVTVKGYSFSSNKAAQGKSIMRAGGTLEIATNCTITKSDIRGAYTSIEP